MPVRFSVVTDLTEPSSELTEALLAAFSQLSEVELHPATAQAASEPQESSSSLCLALRVPCAQGEQAAACSQRGRLQSPELGQCVTCLCTGHLVRATALRKGGRTSSILSPQDHCHLSLQHRALRCHDRL